MHPSRVLNHILCTICTLQVPWTAVLILRHLLSNHPTLHPILHNILDGLMSATGLIVITSTSVPRMK